VNSASGIVLKLMSKFFAATSVFPHFQAQHPIQPTRPRRPRASPRCFVRGGGRGQESKARALKQVVLASPAIRPNIIRPIPFPSLKTQKRIHQSDPAKAQHTWKEPSGGPRHPWPTKAAHTWSGAWGTEGGGREEGY